MSYLNEDQQDWVNYLNSNPDIKCGCGWYTKKECWTICNSKGNQRDEEKAVSDAILREREQCAKIADQYARDHWNLKDSEGNRHNRAARFHSNMIASKIRCEKYSADKDFYAIPNRR